MRRRLRHSIGTLLLVGWCLLFLRCDTTEKSMVRALYLAQNGNLPIVISLTSLIFQASNYVSHTNCEKKIAHRIKSKD